MRVVFHRGLLKPLLKAKDKDNLSSAQQPAPKDRHSVSRALSRVAHALGVPTVRGSAAAGGLGPRAPNPVSRNTTQNVGTNRAPGAAPVSAAPAATTLAPLPGQAALRPRPFSEGTPLFPSRRHGLRAGFLTSRLSEEGLQAAKKLFTSTLAEVGAVRQRQLECLFADGSTTVPTTQDLQDIRILDTHKVLSSLSGAMTSVQKAASCASPDGRILGLVRFRPPLHRSSGHAYIEDIVTTPDSEWTGTGAILVAEALNESMCDVVRLAPLNARSAKAFARLGFEQQPGEPYLELDAKRWPQLWQQTPSGQWTFKAEENRPSDAAAPGDPAVSPHCGTQTLRHPFARKR